MRKGIYCSGDAMNRADAYRRGYKSVCHHPLEIGKLQPGDVLVVDYDHVLFDDKFAARQKMLTAIRQGHAVGIHTFHPDDPKLAGLAENPGVTIAKTHRRLLAALRRLDRRSAASTIAPAQSQENQHVIGTETPDSPTRRSRRRAIAGPASDNCA